MALNLPSSLNPAFDLDLDTYSKDTGHPSNKFNPKPLTVDAVHYRTSGLFATDLEMGETDRLEALQEENTKGGLRALFSKLGDFVLQRLLRVGRVAFPGC